MMAVIVMADRWMVRPVGWRGWHFQWIPVTSHKDLVALSIEAKLALLTSFTFGEGFGLVCILPLLIPAATARAKNLTC